MQKKYLLILGLLLIFITGCKISPFNVEAEVNYVSQEVKGDTTAAKKIEITVSLGNSVYIDSIKEVNATVNGTAVKLKFDNNEINDTNKKIVIYAFVRADGTTIVPLTTNVIQITSIKMEDENGNDITMNGIAAEVKISESGSSDDGTTILVPVTGVKAELKSTTNGYQVELSWTENTFAKKGYRVYRTITTDGIFDASKEKRIDYTGAETTTAVVTTSMESFTDPFAQTAGTTVFYRITAYDGTDETSKQDKAVGIKIIETATNITISTVTGMTVEPDVDSVLIEWAAATATGTDIIGYNIYGCTTINGTFVKMSSLGASAANGVVSSENTKLKIPKDSKFGSEITFTSANPVYMKVKAVGLNGEEGGFSVAVKATMYDSSVPILQAATEIKLVPYGNTNNSSEAKLGAKIEWKSKTGVAIYKIERANDAEGPYSEITEVGANAQNTNGDKIFYIDGSFMELKNKTAYYRIRCVTNTGAVGRPSGAVQVIDYSDLPIPKTTIKSNYLMLSTKLLIDSNLDGILDSYKIYDGTKANIEFDYLNLEDMTSAVVDGLPNDFAGYKIYISNKYDGEYIYAGNASGLWDAQITARYDTTMTKGTTTIQNGELLIGGTTDVDRVLIVDGSKPIYVRVTMYDYFGNESGMSLRTQNILAY